MKKKLLMGMTVVMMMATVVMGNVKQSSAELRFRDKGDWCIPQGQVITEDQYILMNGKKFIEDSNKVKYQSANASILKAVTVKRYEMKRRGFKALKTGTTTVTASYKGKRVTCRVRIFSGFQMPTVKIKATSKKYQVSITNPNNSTITVDKNNVILDYFGESGGFGYGKIAGGNSIQIPAHATKSFCFVTDKGEYCNPDASRIGINYKGYKFMLSLPGKKGKAKLENPTWLDLNF